MRIVRPVWFLLAFIAVGMGVCHASELPVAVDDCLVILLTTTPSEGHPGTGFAIGDGTLVVTAYHVVAEESAAGEHRMLGVIKVLGTQTGTAAPALRAQPRSPPAC